LNPTQPVGGLVHLWNYEQSDEPAGSTSTYPDHVAGRVLALGALATLFRRLKTGRGGHASVAQAEVVAHMLGDLLLKEGVSPGSVRPLGNRSERGAPWGTYPCAGTDQWVTITVRDDADWTRLEMALGYPEWAKDLRYATAEGRLAARDELDAKLVEWTKARTKVGVTAILQMFKVPSAPMYTVRDQLHDPHYQARGYARWIDQQVVGWMAMEGPCFRASGMQDVTIFQAPLVGEHTREIAREILELSDEVIGGLIAKGVFEAAP
jgi:crotonobetainyl-CoA:carnitine CoA-transferase CaiB-like acyl-CoA transferase